MKYIYETLNRKLKMFDEVDAECDRFKKRIAEAKERLKNDDAWGTSVYNCKETAALKRAAIDLKNELTRITQMGVNVFK